MMLVVALRAQLHHDKMIRPCPGHLSEALHTPQLLSIESRPLPTPMQRSCSYLGEGMSRAMLGLGRG